VLVAFVAFGFPVLGYFYLDEKSLGNQWELDRVTNVALEPELWAPALQLDWDYVLRVTA